jgi:hypothetical protein
VNFLQRIKDFIKERKLFIRITLPWIGEKNLGKPMDRTKKITKEEIMKEIRKEER